MDESGSRYNSFASLRAAHNALLKRYREEGDTPEVLTEAEAFLTTGQATGALLDGEEDRWDSQSLLDYWSTMIYRAGRTAPDATLAEFDPELAPEIPDALCPYVGLYAFHEANRNVFCGRERLVGEMVALLKDNRLLSVVGSSGSGKSSLVRAGLLPALRAGALPDSQHWYYYSPMVPGSNPLAALTAAVQPSDTSEAELVESQSERLRSDAGHLCALVDELNDGPVVLVVDQFEELFTLCADPEACQAFVDNLICLAQSPGPRHTVILTMRTDFESRLALFPDLQPLFEHAQVRVTPMSAAELHEAIVSPAESVGLKFEEGVVDALVRDMLGEPAALPLLQFTLLRLWENRERNRITWEAYHRLGGGRLALARSADAFYESLIPEEQVTARRILLRMVRPGEGLEVTSNRIRREALYEAGEARDRVDRVLERLVNEAHLVRLTEGDNPVDTQVEVAHEALVRNWPRLVDWLDEERANMRRRLRLTAAAEQWETLGRDPEALLRGALLEEASAYEDLDDLEIEFVRASRDAVEEARRLEEEARQRELEQARALAEAEHQRAEAQSKAARRLRLLLATLAALFVVALVAGGLLFRQVQQGAELAAIEAEARAAQTRVAAEEGLAVARDAQATAVAKLATAEARGDERDTQATAQAELATAQAVEREALAARETAQASQLTAVAEREAAQSVPTSTPRPTATPIPPTATATATLLPTATYTPVPPTPTPRPVYVIEYLECRPHNFDLGSVKGQVFDTQGAIIPGAQVEIWLNGIAWDDPANPATTNEDGWYEWNLSLGQTVRFHALYVDGAEVTIDPQDFEVQTISRCFQHVNFRQE